MRGRRHVTNNRTTSKLRKKVAAASGMSHSGNRSSGQMVHNMDKCHNLSIPCSSAVRDIICDIFPELSELSCEQSLLGQIIRKYLFEEKFMRLNANNEPSQSKKKRKKKKKNSTKPLVNESIIVSQQSSSIINKNDKQPPKLIVNPKHKLDEFLEKLSVLNNQNDQNRVQIKLPPESRDLSALLEFIRSRYRDFKKCKREGSKRRRVPIASEIPTIPLHKIQLLCERIQCQSCRNKTLGSLNETTSLRGVSVGVEFGNSSLEKVEEEKILNRFTLDASSVAIPNPATKNWLEIPVDGLNHDGDSDMHDVDSAFDYVGMEEGFDSCLPVINNTKGIGSVDLNDVGPRLTFAISRDEISGERFVQLQPQESTDHTDSFPFSTTDVDGLIRHIIIPCGLTELEQQNEEKIPSEEIINMRKEASKMVESIADRMSNLTKQIGAIRSMLHEAREPNAPFAPSMSKKLRECDSKCEIYMESFMEFLIIFHRATSDARCAIHQEQKWLKGIDETLWVGYERAIISLIEPSLNHRWKVIHLYEKCRNAVPLMYNSTTQRTYFQEMIEEKLKILSQLNGILDQVVLCSDEKFAGDSTNLKRAVAYAVYFSHKYIKKRCYDMPNDAFEYKSLLSARSATVCKTIHESKVSNFLEIHAKRTESMRNQAKQLMENMESQGEAIIAKLPQKYESLWKANNILIEERTISDDKKDSQSQASLEIEKNELIDGCYLVGDIGRQCRLFEDFKALDSNQGYNSTVSQGYSEILDGDQIVCTMFGNDGGHDQIPVKCDGGGGRRRVMSIISTCIYGWLQDRCMEWHADLTQKELLSAVDDESLGINGVNGSMPRAKKSSKKKKDRRRIDVKKLSCVIVDTETGPSEKGSVGTKECTSDTISNEDNECTDESLVIREVSQISFVNKGRENQKTLDLDDEKVMSNNINMINSSMGLPDKEKMVPKQYAGSHNFEGIVGQDNMSLLRNSDIVLQGNGGVSVGVVYGTDYISAKDYLISRYLQLHLREEINYVQL